MMKNIYCYTDTLKTISLETDFDESLENKISDFKSKYPDLSNRLTHEGDSIFFLITDNSSYELANFSSVVSSE